MKMPRDGCTKNAEYSTKPAPAIQHTFAVVNISLLKSGRGCFLCIRLTQVTQDLPNLIERVISAVVI